MAETMGGLTIVFAVLGVVLMIAWIIMPFAIIGTKPILRSLLQEQRKTNELLEVLADRQAGASTFPSDTPPRAVDRSGDDRAQPTRIELGFTGSH